MSIVDAHGRPEPPEAGAEIESLRGFLDYQRATLAWKCAGLGADGLRQRTARSTMTLGGILKHMAVVEDGWFAESFLGRPTVLFVGVDWDADPDWEWRTALEDPPEHIRALWEQACAASRAVVAEALAGEGLDQLAVRPWPDGRRPSLRWIHLHMIEEYARHNGHADLLREAVDGETGE